MPTLLLRFPGGRYHATPHGHHVNEGRVEWPPSPWRLLRALIGCGYATQRWREVPPVARRLIESLAATLPSYRLPAASMAHSRHFMPTGVFDKGREKTTLVFDTWADIGGAPLAVRWACELDHDAAELLSVLAAHLGYLGRSESWVLAESIADDAPLPGGFDAYPHVQGRAVERGWEQISVMAAERPDAYSAWRTLAVTKALERFPLPEGKKKPSKKLQRDRARALSPYPADIIDCLERDTAWCKHHRWSQPPGSRRVLYWRRSDALLVGAPMPAARRSPHRVTTMLLALTTPSGRRAALPLLARALPQAELIHRSLVAHRARGERVHCPELTGKDDSGAPLTGHRHAHLLSVDLDDDGHLDHVIIYAPMGLGPAAQQAVRTLKRTWTKGGVHELQLALGGQGALADLRRLPAPLDSGIAAVLGPAAGAREWVSVTPLVLPRYEKRSGRNTLAGQVLAELESRAMPPAEITVLPWDDETRKLRHAVRVRTHGGKPPPVDAGYALRLVFDEPVQGPIALGYASHFGLGVFRAVC